MFRKTGLMVVAASLLASSARADDATAKKAYEKGVMAFDLQHYDDALNMFTRAFEEREGKEPVLLFNIAQCQRQLKQYAAAAVSYRRFLSREPDAPNREQVEKWIEKMDEAAKAAPPPATTTQAAAAPSVDVSPPAYRSVLGWSLLGPGVALLGIGGGLIGEASVVDSRIPGATSLDQAQQLAGDRNAYRVSGAVLLSVGGAATIASCVVFGVAAYKHKAARYASVSSGGAL